MIRAKQTTVYFIATLILLFVIPASSVGEKKSSGAMSSVQRDQALQMLQDVYDRLQKNYFDARYHGIDLDARYKEARRRSAPRRHLAMPLA